VGHHVPILLPATVCAHPRERAVCRVCSALYRSLPYMRVHTHWNEPSELFDEHCTCLYLARVLLSYCRVCTFMATYLPRCLTLHCPSPCTPHSLLFTYWSHLCCRVYTSTATNLPPLLYKHCSAPLHMCLAVVYICFVYICTAGCTHSRERAVCAV
jgi:hypothetical protein